MNELGARISTQKSVFVIHIITGLHVGGAEMMLYKLLRYGKPYWSPPLVVSLTNGGKLTNQIRNLGIEVIELGLEEKRLNVLAFLRLVRLLRSRRPDVVQTWMYHADLFGGVAAYFSGGIPVIWGIRRSSFDPVKSKRRTIFVAKVCAALSPFLPRRILCCSEASRLAHIAMGYCGKRMVVIPNGFDTRLFKPDDHARKFVRQLLGIPGDNKIVGYVARFNLQKDHETFVTAAGILHRRYPEVHFVLCGAGIDYDNALLTRLIREKELEQRFHLLGIREDLPTIVPGFDVATMAAAYGEGFPNVIGEAMACGVPCVVTDVGDSEAIVGSSGIVVEPENPRELARGWEDLIGNDEVRRHRAKLARERIEAHFSIDTVARRYAELYFSVM